MDQRHRGFSGASAVFTTGASDMLQIEFSSVPEPATSSLVGLALLTGGAFAFRRRDGLRLRRS